MNIMEDLKLKFLNDMILTEDDNVIMMDWEHPLMKKHAEVVCRNGGDILEIGFGMGISADYIQQQKPKSHTIVEIHPEIIKRAKEWAKDKQNVIIIEGDWYGVVNDLKTYDGIFYDAEYDKKKGQVYKCVKEKLLRKGGVFTFFNPQGDERENLLKVKDNIRYEIIDMKKINPPENAYLNSDKDYYLPIVEV